MLFRDLRRGWPLAMVGGAEFHEDVEYTATPKQRGYKVTIVDSSPDPDTTTTAFLFKADAGTGDNEVRTLTRADLYDDDGIRSDLSGLNLVQYNPNAMPAVPLTALTSGQVDSIETAAEVGTETVTVEPALVPVFANGATVALASTHITCEGLVRNESTLRFRRCLEDAEGDELSSYVYAYHITGATAASGLTFVAAQGLAEAGSTVTLAADIRESDDRDEVVDTADPAIIYVSANTINTRITNPGRIGIDPFSDPAFSRIVSTGGGSQLTADLGTIAISGHSVNMMPTATTNGMGVDIEPSDLIASANITVSHGVFSDDAFRSLSVGSLRPSRTNPIEDDSISFPVRVGQALGTRTVTVRFDGETAISTWDAGEASVSFAPAASAAGNDYSLPSGASGDLAALSRGGLSTEINMAQSSYGDGATRYQSWVRVANNGANDGSVTVKLYDAATGDHIGSWDSDMIPAGGSIQVSVADLEDNAGYTPGPGQQYNIKVDGGINGYVQHVMWNTVEGLFSDLSGFRAGGGLNTEP